MSHAWMPLYVADYLADTGHLSTIEHGAYMLLIMHYWQTGALPDDDRKLARIARMPAEQWAEIRDTLSELFAPGWKHKRIESELAHASDVISKRSAAAKEMHAKRKASARKVQSTCDANAHANAEQVHVQNAIQSPSPSPVNYTAGAQADSGGPTRADLDRLEDALREAAGPALNAASPGLLMLAPILNLISAGADLEQDVLPAVRQVAARPSLRRGSVRSWEFFTEPIREAHARRIAMPSPLPEVTHERSHKPARQNPHDLMLAALAAECAGGDGGGRTAGEDTLFGGPH